MPATTTAMVKEDNNTIDDDHYNHVEMMSMMRKNMEVVK